MSTLEERIDRVDHSDVADVAIVAAVVDEGYEVAS